ncbi:MAG: MFS transporter [Clostridia bacterium]|nr:MFS transporter [Clostridia bacterium]
MTKLTKKWQMLLYAASGMGVNMLNLMIGSYLCSALIASGFAEEVLPYQTYLGRDLVIAGVWAVFGTVAKILDGIIDIPMASFTDRLKTRFGRRRPAIVIGFIPMIAAYLLFHLIPNDGATLLNTVYYGILLCVFFSFYTLTMVTYYATFTEIVDNVKDRNFISNVKSFFDIVYFILGYVVVRAMLNNMNIIKVSLIVAPISLTMMIPLFLIKEKPSTGETDVKTVNLFKSLAITFKNRDFILWMIVYSFMTFGVQLFLGGINEYFSVSGMSMMIVMACSFAPVPLTLVLYNAIIKKHGFGFAFKYILITFSFSMISMFVIGRFVPAGLPKTIASVAGGLFASLSIGALFAVSYSIPSQLAAEEEERTGISHSAMYFAVQGLFSGVASGIGGYVVLTALKKTEIFGLKGTFFITLVSAAGTLISLVLSFFLPAGVAGMGKTGAPISETLFSAFRKKKD